MEWNKQGLIFCPNLERSWMVSHAQIALPMLVDDSTLRIYFSTRDEKGRSQPAYIEANPLEPSNISKICDEPLWQFGEPGTFDDSGIMPASYVNFKGQVYMYYVGWNPQVTTSYHLAAGLAISEDGGKTFQKYSNGPILDRNTDDPIFRTIPCVFIEDDIWRMWYISCTEWKIVDGKAEPRYLIKYGESHNGIDWKTWQNPCINYKHDGEALGRPWVFKDKNIYKMFYSTRGSNDYRKPNGEPYTIGYAESIDGIYWERKDENVGISRSASGWDSEMLCYCSTYKFQNKHYLLYNGNHFGKTGFGYATSNCN